MTLAPIVNPTVHGVKGKPVVLGFWCMAPGCTKPAQQRHHYWPKSYLRGQPYEWVSVDGIVIANSCGLCIAHHTEVTGDVGGHVAHVRWNPDLKLLEWWETDDTDWVCVGPMKDHDPLLTLTEAEVEREKEGLCPGCGRPKVKKKNKPRKVKSWAVKVPDDAEDGASILDEYVDDLSVALGFGDESKGVRRYHVLINALVWVTMMKQEFLEDWEEAQSA